MLGQHHRRWSVTKSTRDQRLYLPMGHTYMYDMDMIGYDITHVYRRACINTISRVVHSTQVQVTVDLYIIK